MITASEYIMSTEKIYITADQIKNTCTDRDSQETNINWLRDDEILSIETSDNTFLTKMKHIMERDPDNYKCYYYASNVDKKTGKVCAYVFEVSKKLLNFRVNSGRRELTEDEKIALKQRLKK